MLDTTSIIKQRMIVFIKKQGMSLNKFYEKSKVSNGVLGKKGGVSEETIVKFLELFPEINPTWLMTGQEEMMKQKVVASDGDKYITIHVDVFNELKNQLNVKDCQINNLINKLSN
ncbi:MAG: hypothetical protein ISP71_00910 [Flavobacteriales bacterium]|nr:hypothetical protein [Flavobacteriales bacterium]